MLTCWIRGWQHSFPSNSLVTNVTVGSFIHVFTRVFTAATIRILLSNLLAMLTFPSWGEFTVGSRSVEAGETYIVPQVSRGGSGAIIIVILVNLQRSLEGSLAVVRVTSSDVHWLICLLFLCLARIDLVLHLMHIYGVNKRGRKKISFTIIYTIDTFNTQALLLECVRFRLLQQ
jgi:hypothetical protein